MDYIIFPVTQNGIKTFYKTDASWMDVDSSFSNSYSPKNLIDNLREEGFSVEVYSPSISFNFDEI